MKTVCILSGGMDSTVLACVLREHSTLYLLSFDYGQKHKKELGRAANIARYLNADHRIIDLTPVTQLLKSALTDDTAVPHGHYAHESMKVTVVPHRNMLMLTLAAAYADKVGAEQVAYAAHGGDHAIYPDCRPEFVEALQKAWDKSHYQAPRLIAPFIHKTKAEIVTLGAKRGVPFKDTWSCYEGGDKHCGKCGTCVERKEAFFLAGVPDPTEYA